MSTPINVYTWLIDTPEGSRYYRNIEAQVRDADELAKRVDPISEIEDRQNSFLNLLADIGDAFENPLPPVMTRTRIVEMATARLGGEAWPDWDKETTHDIRELYARLALHPHSYFDATVRANDGSRVLDAKAAMRGFSRGHIAMASLPHLVQRALKLRRHLKTGEFAKAKSLIFGGPSQVERDKARERAEAVRKGETWYRSTPRFGRPFDHGLRMAAFGVAGAWHRKSREIIRPTNKLFLAVLAELTSPERATPKKARYALTLWSP